MFCPQKYAVTCQSNRLEFGSVRLQAVLIVKFLLFTIIAALKVAVKWLKVATIDYCWFFYNVFCFPNRFQGKSATANNKETYTYACAE